MSPIITIQVLNWNPNINGLCDNLNGGNYICISAPGGSYIPPSIPNSNTNTSALEHRGGDESSTVGSNNSTAPFSNSTVPTNTTSSPFPGTPGGGSGPAAPSPTQKGISASCTKYDQAKKGDYCLTLAQENNITPYQLYALNNALGDAGRDCNTAFWTGYYYCVSSTDTSVAGGDESTGVTTAQPVIETALAVARTTIITTTATTTTCDPTSTQVSNSNPASLSPTQSGIASPCARYAQAHKGGTCASFASANQITPADLYCRNGALGTNGENFETKFWGGYYYCVGGTD